MAETYDWKLCQLCGEESTREITTTGVRVCDKHAVQLLNEGIRTVPLYKKRR